MIVILQNGDECRRSGVAEKKQRIGSPLSGVHQLWVGKSTPNAVGAFEFT
jgi:hypothetical protein